MGKVEESKYSLNYDDFFTIRTATSDDAENVISYTKEIFKESEYLLTTVEEFQMTVEDEKRFLQNSFDDEGSLTIIATYKDQIIGFLNFQNGRKKRIKHVGEFGMSVAKAFRRMGIGKKLLETLLQWAKDNPIIEKVSLEVFDANKQAISLYKKIGFEEEGRKKKGIKINENTYYDIIFMSKFTK